MSPATDSRKFCHLTVTQPDFALGFVSSSNRSVVFDSQQESSNQDCDRAWCRWTGFCRQGGLSADPFLTGLSPVGQEFFCRACFSCIRSSEWTPSVALLMGSVSNQWSQTLWGKLQATWLRCFGTISNRVPFTSRA
jgi:hypothetical protein